jgi:hypothetical protein
VSDPEYRHKDRQWKLREDRQFIGKDVEVQVSDRTMLFALLMDIRDELREIKDKVLTVHVMTTPSGGDNERTEHRASNADNHGTEVAGGSSGGTGEGTPAGDGREPIRPNRADRRAAAAQARKL